MYRDNLIGLLTDRARLVIVNAQPLPMVSLGGITSSMADKRSNADFIEVSARVRSVPQGPPAKSKI
jgi:hypothetical protein